MIRSFQYVFALAIIFCSPFAAAGVFTDIYYSVEDLGTGQWEYTYDVYNHGLSGGIEEFTVWFDHGLYNNLVITTPETPPEWSQIVWDVEPVLGDAGGYDASATNLSIAITTSLSGFSVSFDWLGTGDPGMQFYEIIDPVTFNTIDEGQTIAVPEPVTLCLLGIGGAILLRRR